MFNVSDGPGGWEPLRFRSQHVIKTYDNPLENGQTKPV